jgi:hypothetical protein
MPRSILSIDRMSPPAVDAESLTRQAQSQLLH